MKLFCTVFSVWLLLFSGIVNGQIIECEDFEECTTSQTTSDAIYSRGYKSITGSTVDITAGSGGVVSNGYYSIFDINSITSTSDGLTCDGDISCTSMSTSSIFPASTYCNGANSCTNNIGFKEVVSCSGQQSCSYTIIQTDKDTLHVNSAYGMYQSQVSTTAPIFSIYLTGHFAGYGLQVICPPISISCTVYCRGTGCNGTSLVCPPELPEFPEITSETCGFDYSLDANADQGSESGHISVPGFSLLIDTLSNSQVLATTCESSMNSVLDYPGTGIQPSKTDIADTICCAAENACYHPTEISTDPIGDHEILCGGKRSCKNVGEIKTYGSTSGNVICTGTESCTHVRSIEGENTVQCTGYKSCQYSNISIANEVICGGEAACANTNIKGVANIYGLSQDACRNATIESAGVGIMELHFEAPYSGYSNITCSSGDTCIINCNVYESCSNQDTTVYYYDDSNVQVNCWDATDTCVTFIDAEVDQYCAYPEDTYIMLLVDHNCPSLKDLAECATRETFLQNLVDIIHDNDHVLMGLNYYNKKSKTKLPLSRGLKSRVKNKLSGYSKCKYGGGLNIYSSVQTAINDLTSVSYNKAVIILLSYCEQTINDVCTLVPQIQMNNIQVISIEDSGMSADNSCLVTQPGDTIFKVDISNPDTSIYQTIADAVCNIGEP